MKLAGAVLGALALAVGAAPAMAEADPGWYDGHSSEQRQALVDYAYDSSAEATVPYSGEAATLGEQVADDVAGTDGMPLAPDVAGEELTTLGGAELLAPVEVLAPELILAGGALAAGVAIVDGTRSLFMRLAAPGDAAEGGTNWSWDEVSWYEHGYEILFGATVQQSPGAYLYVSHDGAGVIRWFQPPCDFSGFTPAAGARMETGVASTATCREWVEEVGPVDFPVLVDYPYLLPSDIAPAAPPRPYHSETDHADSFVSPQTDPGAEVVEEGLRGLDGAGDEDLREELDWALTPGAQEKEEPASDGTKVTTDDRACKAWFEEAPGLDPGARSPEAEPRAADWDYDVDEFPGVYNPLTRSTQTVKLRWGTKAWGYRHIVLGHGWSPAMRARTALALQDRAPQADRRAGSFVYLGDLEGGPSGVRCRQRVIVSYVGDETVPVGRHIITSYLEAY